MCECGSRHTYVSPAMPSCNQGSKSAILKQCPENSNQYLGRNVQKNHEQQYFFRKMLRMSTSMLMCGLKALSFSILEINDNIQSAELTILIFYIHRRYGRP